MAQTSYPPGPRSRLPGAAFLAYRRDPIALFSRLRAEYGDVAGFRIGPERFVLLSHPDHIRDVLVTHHRNFEKGIGLQRAKVLLGEGLLTSEGEYHRRQRRLAQPAFHHRRVESYGAVMVEYTERTVSRWEDGATLDVWQEMMRLTLAIVGKTLFDADVEEDARDVGESLTTVLDLFNLMLLPFAPAILRLPLPPTRRFRTARDRLDAVISRLIADRRAAGTDRGDLLSMLLLAQDAEDGSGGMSDEQLRDEALTILLAGHETTANLLTWSFYLLAQHPDFEAALHAELEDALEGRLPTATDLQKLPYTRLVLTETMRLYPPAWVIGRRALGPFEVGGYTLPAGAVLLMSQYLVHRDARYYPEPERFMPERWSVSADSSRPRHAYFPFGGGPRQCIGEGFAWMEGMLLLATIAQSWRLRLAPGHRVGLRPQVTLRPAHGMRMALQKR